PLIRNEKKRNAAVAILNGEIIGEYHKQILPNYGVFDEKRLFESGNSPLIINYKNKNIGIHICEDSWELEHNAVQSLIGNIDYLINLSASPYHHGKKENRINILKQTAKKISSTLLYCNLIGGQDELVFDGGSLVISAEGKIISNAKYFEEDKLTWNYNNNFNSEPDKNEEIYKALKLGLTDYVKKTGFKKVLIGLSGGIDSALVLSLAVDALGSDKVIAVTMPSEYSSMETLNDAIKMAKILNIKLHQLPITNAFNQFKESLSAIWGKNKKMNLTEENLQARIRGNLIMALSNEYNWLLITTGNKSEIAMGYCTLYGDMCGGFALIKDVPKTMVYDLCKWRNKKDEIIPESIINRPPSAELRPNQKDSDSLPSYDILDSILEAYIEKDMGYRELVSNGYNPDDIKFIISNVERNEYKRRQTPPGVKITSRSFDRDRRMPIINKYKN
ncbi:MAG: NAD+ synthase, partial [Pontiellaceae bacterium]